MHNLIILFFHIAVICSLLIFALRFGKEWVIAWLSILAIAMNLFVLKQVTFFKLNVTASDSLAVGYLLGLNLIQEFFGQKMARRTVWISFFTSASFILLTQFHIAYTPNRFDVAHPFFTFIFTPLPRLVLASLFTFVLVQLVDLSFFNFLRQKTEGRYLTLRTTAALLLSQILDTLLFSFLGLYGLVESIGHIIVFSFLIKGLVILLSVPFVTLSKRFVKYDLQI